MPESNLPFGCPCDDTDEFGYHDECPIHVGCDEKCRALREPITLDHLLLAYRHWRYHHYLHGCSHAC